MDRFGREWHEAKQGARSLYPLVLRLSRGVRMSTTRGMWYLSQAVVDGLLRGALLRR